MIIKSKKIYYPNDMIVFLNENIPSTYKKLHFSAEAFKKKKNLLWIIYMSKGYIFFCSKVLYNEEEGTAFLEGIIDKRYSKKVCLQKVSILVELNKDKDLKSLKFADKLVEKNCWKSGEIIKSYKDIIFFQR